MSALGDEVFKEVRAVRSTPVPRDWRLSSKKRESGPDMCGGRACGTREETAGPQATEGRPESPLCRRAVQYPAALRGGDVWVLSHTVGGGLAMAALPPH